MKTLRALGLALLLVVAASAEPWLTSWEEAQKQSKLTRKPILMDFTGSDWCGWCIKLKSEVFSTKAFQDWADRNVVLLELDFPQSVPQSDAVKKQNKMLAEKYGIQGYPTVVFANAQGESLGTLGYEKGGPQVWTKLAQDIIKKK